MERREPPGRPEPPHPPYVHLLGDGRIPEVGLTMSSRRAAGSVVLGLLVALAAVLGVACLCTHGHVPQSLAVSSAYGALDGGIPEHACASSGHGRCGTEAAADTPTTGPVPHPLPQAWPARVEVRPAAFPAAAVRKRPAAPRAPDLYTLQVLRT